MQLTPPQADIFNNPARHRVLVAGRRFGKSVLSCNELIRAAQQGRKLDVYYVAPYLKMSRNIMWPMLNDAIPKSYIAESNKQDLYIKLKGYDSTIHLLGADNPDALRGISISFLVADEIQDIDLETIDMVLAPAMADQRADGLYIGTPKGKGANTAYQLYLRGKTDPDWKSWHYTTAEGGNVPKEEIEAAKRRMSAKQFQQEFMASFITMLGRVYYAFDIEESVSDKAVDTGGTIHVGMDFNVGKMCACLCSVTPDGIVHVFDEIVLEDSNTREMCHVINTRYPNRDIIVYPDPAGKAKSTKTEVGQTDFTIIKEEFKWQLLARSAHPRIIDRVNNLNSMLMNADNERRLFVNPNCREVIACLDGQVYKAGTNIPDKDSNLDHMNDALGYFIDHKFSLIKREAKVIQLDWSY